MGSRWRSRVKDRAGFIFLVLATVAAGARAYQTQGRSLFLLAILGALVLVVMGTIGQYFYLRGIRRDFRGSSDVLWQAQGYCPQLRTDRYGMLWITEKDFCFGKNFDEPVIQLDWTEINRARGDDRVVPGTPRFAAALTTGTSQESFVFFLAKNGIPLQYSAEIRDQCLLKVEERIQPGPDFRSHGIAG